MEIFLQLIAVAYDRCPEGLLGFTQFLTHTANTIGLMMYPAHIYTAQRDPVVRRGVW